MERKVYGKPDNCLLEMRKRKGAGWEKCLKISPIKI
jgi:hypothetical protein